MSCVSGRPERRRGAPSGGASAGRGGDVQMVRVLDGRRVVLRHLDGYVAGDVGGAATAAPRLGLQELARVVGAVAETRAVEGRVRAVHLLLGVALGEQVHGHHTSPLWQGTISPRSWLWAPCYPRTQNSRPLASFLPRNQKLEPSPLPCRTSGVQAPRPLLPQDPRSPGPQPLLRTPGVPSSQSPPLPGLRG